MDSRRLNGYRAHSNPGHAYHPYYDGERHVGELLEAVAICGVVTLGFLAIQLAQ